MTKPENSSNRRSKVGEQRTKPENSSIRRSKVGEQRKLDRTLIDGGGKIP